MFVCMFVCLFVCLYVCHVQLNTVIISRQDDILRRYGSRISKQDDVLGGRVGRST